MVGIMKKVADMNIMVITIIIMVIKDRKDTMAIIITTMNTMYTTANTIMPDIITRRVGIITNAIINVVIISINIVRVRIQRLRNLWWSSEGKSVQNHWWILSG